MFFVSIGVLVATGAVLLLAEFPAVVACISASGAGERRSLKILAPVLLLSGVGMSALPSSAVRQAFSPLSCTPGFDVAVCIAVSCLATLLVVRQFRAYPTAAGALAGALLAFPLTQGAAWSWNIPLTLLLTFVAAPAVCCLLSALLGLAFKALCGRREHLVRMDRKAALVATLAALLLLAAFAYNAGVLVTLFLPATGGSPVWAIAAYAAVFLLIWMAVLPAIRARAWSLADTDLDLDNRLLGALLMAVALTFFLFSWVGVRRIGLYPAPLSAGVLVVSGLMGLSLIQRRRLVEAEPALSTMLAWFASPLISGIVCYSLGMILGGNAVLALVATAILLVAALTWSAVRSRRNRLFRDAIAQVREQQIAQAQEAISSMEVRSETTEKELLGKLELKRKELVDFAVGISDQKAYMEEVYARLKEIRSARDLSDKDAAVDTLLSSLRERMYFTQEMNDFYARSEVLHKDFNLRLREAYPDLTDAERKLANLLRQGFSSKYIASLMNITPKSVEMGRYRLRQRLGLQRSDNLIQFIKSI